MDHSAVSLILKELNLNEQCVANIYNHGSWVYGTNSPESDRDLILVTRSSDRKTVEFHEDFDYFHEFELHKLWNQYDVCIYSIENFEILLQKNSLVVVQCLFLPKEFKLKEEIDFQSIYLEKYYNPLRLKQVAFYEMETDFNLYENKSYQTHPKYSSRSIETSQYRLNYVFKNLFHGIRYLDFVEQLIQTKSIHNFRRATHLFHQMKELGGDPIDDLGLARVAQFVREKVAEYKPKFDVLIPGDVLKGTFEVHIIFDSKYTNEEIVDELEKTCRNTKYKMTFIEWIKFEDDENVRQLMVSAQYNGGYPSIVKQIKEEAYEYFKDFDIIRIKIKSLISNEGVPESALERQLFWNENNNYFEFQYKITIKRYSQGNNMNTLRHICQSRFRELDPPRLSHKLSPQTHTKNEHYMITLYVSDGSRGNAIINNNQFTKYLPKNELSPLKVIQEFVVYDTASDLDFH